MPSPFGASVPKCSDRGQRRARRAAPRPARRRAATSQSACEICALSMICVSSFARSSGIVADRDAAGLDHREPACGHRRAVRPAQQHAIAGHQPEVLDEHARVAVRALGRAPRRSSARRPARRSRCARPSRARARRREAPSRSSTGRDSRAPADRRGAPAMLARRQVVARERVDVRGRSACDPGLHGGLAS